MRLALIRPLALLCSNYAELDDATLIVGTIIAYSYITMTGANVQGATISLSAAVTLTGAAVRLPFLLSTTRLSLSLHTPPVNMLSASSFAILAGSALTNTVRRPTRVTRVCVSASALRIRTRPRPLQGLSLVRGNVGCYPGTADDISVSEGCGFIWKTSGATRLLHAPPLLLLQGMVLNGRNFGAGGSTGEPLIRCCALNACGDTDASVSFRALQLQPSQTFLVTIYASLSSRSSTPIPSALDGTILASGAYSCSGPGLTLSADSVFVLDGGGNPASVFVLITPGYLHVSPNAVVVLRNGARASNGA